MKPVSFLHLPDPFAMALARRFMLIALCFLMAACGAKTETATGQLPDDGVTPSDPVPVADLVAPINAPAIEGRWMGILSCAGRDFPTQLDLTAQAGNTLAGRWTIAPALGRGRYISPDGRTEISDRLLKGDFDPITGLATLREAVDSRPLMIRLLINETGALLAFQRCDFGLMAPAPADAIEAIRSELVLLQQPVVLDAADQDGACPADLEKWIQLGLALPPDDRGRRDLTRLWSADFTVPIFGQAVATLGAERRIEIRRALQGRCGLRRDRERNAIVNHLASITDLRSFRNSVFTARARVLAEDWLQSRVRPVLEAEPVPELERATASALTRIPPVFAFDRLFTDAPGYDGKDYALRLVAINETLSERQRLQDFLDNMGGARFFRLQELWFAALARDDIDDEAATRVAMQQLVAAARAQVEEADDARSARAMAAWVAGVEAGVLCTDATRRRCHEAADVFKARLTVLADRFAAASGEELKVLARQDKGLPTLAALIEGDRELEQTYGHLLAYAAFTDHMEDRADLRYALQRDLEDTLAGRFTAARTTAALGALEARYFAVSDLRERPARHLRRIGSVYDEQLRGTRPFAGTGADDYLNALYNREFATLARLDAELLAPVRPIYGFMAGQVEALAGLLGAAGRPLQSAALELRQPSAATAVALRYLLAYEERYAACLGPDAATVTFTERRDTVTRTRSGIELSRIEGVPVSTRYRIKRAHLELFADVFSAPETPGAGKVFATLLGLDDVTRLTDGVAVLMADYPCDAESVKGFEAGLLAYYNDRKRRWGR